MAVSPTAACAKRGGVPRAAPHAKVRRSRLCDSMRSSTRRSGAVLTGSTRVARASPSRLAERNARSRCATSPATTGNAEASGDFARAVRERHQRGLLRDAAWRRTRIRFAPTIAHPSTKLWPPASTSRGPPANSNAFCALPTSISVADELTQRAIAGLGGRRRAGGSKPWSSATSRANRSGWVSWTSGSRRGASGCPSSTSWPTTAAGDA